MSGSRAVGTTASVVCACMSMVQAHGRTCACIMSRDAARSSTPDMAVAARIGQCSHAEELACLRLRSEQHCLVVLRRASASTCGRRHNACASGHAMLRGTPRKP